MTNRRDLLRALVGLMKTLAAAYGIMIPASQRAATDEEVKKWYKKLIRRVHPDKGGCNGDFGNYMLRTKSGRAQSRKSAARKTQKRVMPSVG